MPTTLTYGRKVPVDTDGQESWTQSIEENIALDDAHDHDGSDSTRLAHAAITTVTQTIASGSWAASGNSDGLYKQTVTLPGSLQFDDISPTFKIDDDIIFPTVEKVSSTTYDIYINDNSKNIVAVYR